MNIRSAAAADTTSILGFWREHAAPTHTNDADAVARLIGTSSASLLLAEDEGELIGTVVAGWDGWRGNLYRLAVADTHRRQGVARRLIAEAEAWLFARGARRIAAIVDDDNQVARRTWSACGYARNDGQGRFVKSAG